MKLARNLFAVLCVLTLWACDSGSGGGAAGGDTTPAADTPMTPETRAPGDTLAPDDAADPSETAGPVDVPPEPDVPEIEDDTVYAIQDAGAADHPEEGAEVYLVDVVVTAVDLKPTSTGFWVQEPEGGLYGGIFVYMGKEWEGIDEHFGPGDQVQVAGTYIEYYELSAIQGAIVNVTGSGPAPAPLAVTPEDLAADPEPYEGLLVEVCGGCQVTALLEYGEVSTTCVRLDDEIFLYDLEVGDGFDCITGLWHYNFENYKLLPRDASDLVAAAQTYAPLYGKCGVDGLVCDEAVHLCGTLSSQVGHGYCLETCTPGGAPCSGGVPCLDAGFCDLPGDVAPDAPCDLAQEGQSLDFGALCQPSMSCVGFFPGAGGSICLPVVDSCDGGDCGPGRLCTPLMSGVGACGLECAGAGVDCAGDLVCEQIAEGWICIPDSAGPVEFGKICDSGAKETNCLQGLTCMKKDAGSVSGYCSKTCESDADCPKVTNSDGTQIAAFCGDASAGDKSCFFGCGQPGQKCPDDLDCTSIGGGQLCLAP
jgi:hypothetical protein